MLGSGPTVILVWTIHWFHFKQWKKKKTLPLFLKLGLLKHENRPYAESSDAVKTGSTHTLESFYESIYCGIVGPSVNKKCFPHCNLETVKIRTSWLPILHYLFLILSVTEAAYYAFFSFHFKINSVHVFHIVYIKWFHISESNHPFFQENLMGHRVYKLKTYKRSATH